MFKRLAAVANEWKQLRQLDADAPSKLRAASQRFRAERKKLDEAHAQEEKKIAEDLATRREKLKRLTEQAQEQAQAHVKVKMQEMFAAKMAADPKLRAKAKEMVLDQFEKMLTDLPPGVSQMEALARLSKAPGLISDAAPTDDGRNGVGAPPTTATPADNGSRSGPDTAR
jgi:flagellar biosynthesis GTPase FlhF